MPIRNLFSFKQKLTPKCRSPLDFPPGPMRFITSDVESGGLHLARRGLESMGSKSPQIQQSGRGPVGFHQNIRRAETPILVSPLPVIQASLVFAPFQAEFPLSLPCVPFESGSLRFCLCLCLLFFLRPVGPVFSRDAPIFSPPLHRRSRGTAGFKVAERPGGDLGRLGPAGRAGRRAGPGRLEPKRIGATDRCAPRRRSRFLPFLLWGLIIGLDVYGHVGANCECMVGNPTCLIRLSMSESPEAILSRLRLQPPNVFWAQPPGFENPKHQFPGVSNGLGSSMES